MNCSYCGAPLPVSGLVCSYCGQRNAINMRNVDAVVGTGESTVNCPVCTETELKRMDVGLRGRVVIHHCGKCDGIFLSQHDLDTAIDAKHKQINHIDPKLLRFVLDNPRHERQTRKRFYIHCPVCKNMMQQMNYRAVSGVVIDRCREHGVWLDGGELQQLFEWKGAGGIVKAEKFQSFSPRFPTGGSSGSFIDNQIDDFFMWLFGLK